MTGARHEGQEVGHDRREEAQVLGVLAQDALGEVDEGVHAAGDLHRRDGDDDGHDDGDDVEREVADVTVWGVLGDGDGRPEQGQGEHTGTTGEADRDAALARPDEDEDEDDEQVDPEHQRALRSGRPRSSAE